MLRLLLAFLLLAAGLAKPIRSQASSVIVPDDFASVQSAIDSRADTVFVRAGTYAETPLAIRGVVLIGVGATRSILDGFAISNDDPLASTLWSATNIEFLGRIEITTANVHPRYLEIAFYQCSLLSGLKHLVSSDPYDIGRLRLVNSRLNGAFEARAASIAMEADTINGTVACVVGDDITIQHCCFVGSVGTAIDVTGDNVAGTTYIATNTISGYDIGILTSDDDVTTIDSNNISDCGIGVRLASAFDVRVLQNIVADCTVGMDIAADIMHIERNVVLRSIEWGIQLRGLDAGSVVAGNIIGGCGTGLHVSRQFGSFSVIGNTVFNCRGSGIEVVRPFDGSVAIRNNISYGNGGWGLLVSSELPAALECNDWFGNALGSVGGVGPGATDVAVDPLFCNVGAGDVHLLSTSPLINRPSCGQIGALGVGCGTTSTLLRTLNVEVVETGLTISWGVGAADVLVESWIERAPDGSGPWEELRDSHRGGTGLNEFTDVDVQRGRRYWYRVRWTADESRSSAAVWGIMPLATESLVIYPNPSNGPVRIEWRGANDKATTLEIVDLAGRTVSVIRGRAGVSNRALFLWDGLDANARPVRAGWYVVRVRSTDAERAGRFMLLR